MSHSIPDGFAPWKPASSYMGHLDSLGPIHWRETDLAFGVRIGPAHRNQVGIAHGGFLATLADCALGQVIVRQNGVSVVTVQLGVEYLNAVKEGDWLETRVHIDKPGKRLVHATCLMETAGQDGARRLALKANGVFAVIGQAPPSSSEFDG